MNGLVSASLVLAGAALVALSGVYARAMSTSRWAQALEASMGASRGYYWGQRIGAILTGIMSMLIGLGVVPPP